MLRFELPASDLIRLDDIKRSLEFRNELYLPFIRFVLKDGFAPATVCFCSVRSVVGILNHEVDGD